MKGYQMNRFLIIILLISSVLTYGHYETSFLNENDFSTAKKINLLGPVITSVIDTTQEFESYVEWRCYEINRIKTRCSKYDYSDEQSKYIPGFKIINNNLSLDFDIVTVQNFNCETTILKWELLMNGSDHLCLLSAVLEEGNTTRSFEFYQVKSNTGYWKSNYFTGL